ncbi:MAG: hypothetical protein A3F11_02935 [Gammaproteobacteria bacterium RIFCSPHIGHO2_12_FULL_37_14]|nr:MAG: hypothetical protein A3F11_02935 [Gammaproteobacteria bacterium RIFCSPHIGHO2_12_FULL_37_14]
MSGRKWLYDLPHFMLGMLLIFFLAQHAPNLEYDIDPSYIMFGQARPPLYPLFIWLFHWAGPYQFYIIMWLQGALLFTALMYARFWLKKNLQLTEFLIFLISAIVLVTISFHFQIWHIQSEGLAFPFFIFTLFLLIECFQAYNLKKLCYLAGMVSLLVLTRLQFYYFYGIFAILLAWYVWQRTPVKSLVATALILFGSMSLTTITDHTYHYFKHGIYFSGSYAGLMILVQALYLADDNAADYLNNQTEKDYVKNMIIQRNAQGLNQDAALINTLKPSYFEYAYQAYSRNYLALQRIIDETLKTSVENTFGNVPISEANATALSIDKVLISHAIKKNLTFLIWKFVKCMGGIPLFLFFSIFLFMLPFKIIKNKIRYPDVAAVFVGVVTIITFFNAAIIAMCNPDLPVYFCYSQFMFYCLAALLVNISFQRDAHYVKGSFDQSFLSR